MRGHGHSWCRPRSMYTGLGVYISFRHLSTGRDSGNFALCVDRGPAKKYNRASLFVLSIAVWRCPFPEIVIHEENLPTQPPETCTHPRFSRPHGDEKRPKGIEGTPGEGTRTPNSLRRGPTGAGFPRSARLRRSREYRRVFARPAKSVDDYFTVLARPNEGDTARLGLVIAKRCAPGAVQRTRLKRIVRESFRKHRQDLARIDYVVLCRHRATESGNGTLRASLSAHWKKIVQQLCAGSSSF